MARSRDSIHQEFLTEAHELIEALSRDLLLLDEGQRRGKLEADRVNEAFRSVHTLKGIAGMFGYAEVGTVAHALEDLLDGLRLGRLEVSQALLDVLFDGVELFQSLLSLAGAKPPADEDAIDKFVAITQDLASRVSLRPQISLDAFDLDDDVLGVLTEYEEHRLTSCVQEGLNLYRMQARFALSAIDSSIEELKQSAQPDAEIITYIPSLDGGDLDTIELVVLVASALDLAQLEARFENRYGAIEEVSRRAVPGTEISPQEEAFDTTPPPAGSQLPIALGGTQLVLDQGQEHLAQPVISNTVRVDIGKLDHLMNVVAEMAMVRGMVANIVDKLGLDADYRRTVLRLQRIDRRLERSLAEMRSGLLDVRMVPLGELFSRMARTARAAAREHGKEVHLVVTGAGTEVDKLIVEELANPLMHLVRNAIDHGIESMTKRDRIGKANAGTLALNAYHRGSSVVIEVEDDGAGMDPERIRATAVRRELVTAQTAVGLSDKELYGLVFLPGFSTMGEATSLSGRGVGMDVVRTNIGRLGGAVDIESELGIGTKITITLPITLAIIRALIVGVQEESFAVPINAVQEVVPLRGSVMRTVQGRPVLNLRGEETLPLCFVAEQLRLGEPDKTQGFVVVANVGSQRLGLVVDQLDGQRDVIIKSLGKSLSRVRAISGAAELDDQRLALVLDVSALVDELLESRGSFAREQAL